MEGWADFLGTQPAKLGRKPALIKKPKSAKKKKTTPRKFPNPSNINLYDWPTPYLVFQVARERVRNANLKNKIEWEDWLYSDQSSKGIPTDPAVVYREHGWSGWDDFLGIENPVHKVT